MIDHAPPPSGFIGGGARRGQSHRPGAPLASRDSRVTTGAARLPRPWLTAGTTRPAGDSFLGFVARHGGASDADSYGGGCVSPQSTQPT